MAMITVMAMVVTTAPRTLHNLPGRRRRSTRTRPSGKVILARVALVTAVLSVGLAAASHAVANITADMNPELALRVVPSHPVALTARAQREFRDGDIQSAEAAAEKAIRNSATASGAFETLALLEANGKDQTRTRRMFEYTSLLNRREIPTQIWLFQRGLVTGDVGRALQHIDAAMRASRRSREALYPLLAGAIAVDGLIAPVSDMFAREPEWLYSFLRHAILSNAALVNFANIIPELPEDSVARTTNMQALLLDHLVKTGEFGAATEFMDKVAEKRTDGWIRDPAFTANGPYQPFDWSYIASPELNAHPSAEDGGGLEYFAGTGRGGSVARQLLTLPPGAYSIASMSQRLSTSSDARASWTIKCVSASSPVVRLPLTEQSGRGPNRFNAAFAIPTTDCPAQWLELNVQATFDPGGTSGLVQWIRIEPRALVPQAPAAVAADLSEGKVLHEIP